MLGETPPPQSVVLLIEGDHKNVASTVTSAAEAALAGESYEASDQAQNGNVTRPGMFEVEQDLCSYSKHQCTYLLRTSDENQAVTDVCEGRTVEVKLAFLLDEPFDDVPSRADAISTNVTSPINFESTYPVSFHPTSQCSAAEEVDECDGVEELIVATDEPAELSCSPQPLASTLLIVIEDWSGALRWPYRPLLEEITGTPGSSPPAVLGANCRPKSAPDISGATRASRGGGPPRGRSAPNPIIVIEDWSSK